MEDHVGYSLGEDDIKKEDEVEIELKVDPSPAVHELARLQCHVCYKMMGHRSSLYKHLKYVHKIEPAHRFPISCREKDCFQSFTFIDPFRRHLAEQHGFDIVVEKYVFQSMSDFFNWKKVTEEEENLRFIVSTGPRNSKNGKTHYYRCQKNGAYKPEFKKRLLSDDRDSIYNMSTTHCIASMFVFEEPSCVTVEFCRTHYGHDVSSKAKPPSVEEKLEEGGEPYYAEPEEEEQHAVNYESIDSCSKLNSVLSEKDKAALMSILQENQHLLQETEELYYENEEDVVLKIPYSVLKSILEEEDNKEDKGAFDDAVDGPIIIKDEICDEAVIENLNGEERESENSTILKSLGNGVFLDTTSNKRLKLDSFKKKTKVKEKRQSPEAAPQKTKAKDKEKNNTMLVKEYLNEFDEKVYVLELMKEEETLVQKREKILSQLQSILMMVNNETDTDVLDEIQNHLSKYAPPE